MYIFSLCLLYMLLAKNEMCGEFLSVSARSPKETPHFRFCQTVFRLERHAVGYAFGLLRGSETVLCAMLEKPKSALTLQTVFELVSARKRKHTRLCLSRAALPFIYP